MNFKDFKKYIWSHFLQIENDFLAIEPYLSFDSDNFSAFSEKLFSLYQIIGSEIDVVSKVLCNKLNPNKDVGKINEYATEILSKYPKFEHEEIWVNKFEIIIKPWDNWSAGSPKWWQLYNKTKHTRTTKDSNNKPYFNSCNLQNVLMGLSALFVLDMYLLREIILESQQSREECYVSQSKLFNLQRLDSGISFFKSYDFDGVEITHNLDG